MQSKLGQEVNMVLDVLLIIVIVSAVVLVLWLSWVMLTLVIAASNKYVGKPRNTMRNFVEWSKGSFGKAHSEGLFLLIGSIMIGYIVIVSCFAVGYTITDGTHHEAGVG